MIKVTYRLVGDVSYSHLTKEFNTWGEVTQWTNDTRGTILVISVESSGASVLQRLYG